MMRLQYSPWRAGWTMSLVASLCIILTLWLGYRTQGHAGESPRDIMVHQGWLSVHLQEADVKDVLTMIGQQAGITILGDLRPGIRVSAQFSGMPLDDGLRRLLRLASLSSTMVYTHGLLGAVVLTAVHVFEEATGPAPHPQPATESSAEDRREEAGPFFAEALAQLSSTVPSPPAVPEIDEAKRFRALLESAQHHRPSLGAGEERELARHFREVLEQTLQSPDDTSPRDLPSREYRE
jgi:hypothetical protein